MSPREDSQFSSGWQTRSGVRPRSTASGSVATRASQDTAEPIWDPKGLNDDPAVRNYVLVCLAALVVLLVALLYQDVGTVSLAPVLVGMLGVVTRWRAAPVVVLIALAGVFYLKMVPYFGMARGVLLETPHLVDVVLCAAVLAFVAGHYRLQALVRAVVPQERFVGGKRSVRREPTGHRLPPELSPRRAPRVVAPVEVGRLGVAVLLWSGVALASWSLLPVHWDYFDLRPQDWQGMVLAWVLGGGLLVVSNALHYLGHRRLSPAEARLFLQDVAWRETRREQRRLNRWLAWARLRRQRRKERS